MPLMTANEYKQGSRRFRSGHKNPIASDIQTLLSEYEKPNASANRKLKLLALIYFLCLEFERAKGTKLKEGNKTVVLRKQVEAEINSPAFTAGLDDMVAGKSFKGGNLRTNPNPAQPGTKLKGVYTNEQVLPRQNFAEKLQLKTKVKAFGLSILLQTLESDFQIQQNMGMQASEAAAQAKVGGMTRAEIMKEVHKLWANTAVANYEFSFFNAADRQQYEATCTGGVISCNGRTPYTTGYAPSMYVLSRSNQLYIPDGISTGSGKFNHSSMLSGDPVLCAGTLQIDGAGHLTQIDNDSGHYKPDTNALLDAVDFLVQTWNINPGTFQVRDKVTGITYTSATSFLTAVRFVAPAFAQATPSRTARTGGPAIGGGRQRPGG